MTVSCSGCGKTLSAQARFCGACGRPSTRPADELAAEHEASPSAGSHGNTPVATPSRSKETAGVHPVAASTVVTWAAVPVVSLVATYAISLVFRMLQSQQAGGPISGWRLAADDVVEAFGGSLSTEFGGTYRVVPFLSLVAVAVAVAFFALRRLKTAALPGYWRAYSLPLSALVAAVLVMLVVFTLAGTATEVGVSPGFALLFGPLLLGTAGVLAVLPKMAVLKPWRRCLTGAVAGLAPVAVLLGVLLGSYLMARTLALVTVQTTPSVVNVFTSMLEALLLLGTYVTWMALALMGVPVAISTTPAVDGSASTSVSIAAFSNSLPLVANAIVLVLIVATGVLVATRLVRLGDSERRALWWRLPAVVAPLAGVGAFLSSWAPASQGAQWPVAAMWAVIVGLICHPGVSRHWEAHVPRAPWSLGDGQPWKLWVGIGIVVWLSLVAFATVKIQESRSSEIGAVAALKAAWQSGDSETATDLLALPVAVGRPMSVSVANSTLTAELADGSKSVIAVDVYPSADRQFGVFVDR